MSDEIATTMNDASIVDDERTKSAKTITTAVYILQVASYLLPITFLVAVLVNYVTKSEVEGTWLESHCRWQIRTFWFELLWTIVGGVPVGVAVIAADAALKTETIEIIESIGVIGATIIIASEIWFIYRIVRGWLRVRGGKEMYEKS